MTASPSPEALAIGEVLEAVLGTIAARKRGEGMTNAEGKSYVRRLLDKGVPKINAKIEEEAGELCAALAGESDAQVYAETADLLFHVLVGLSARDLRFEEVTRVLAGRLGVSGIDEKAARGATGTHGTPDADAATD